MQYTTPGTTSLQAGATILVLAALGIAAGYAIDKPVLRHAGVAMLPAGVHLTLVGGIDLYRARTVAR